MDDDFIVTAFVVIDKTRAAPGHRDDVRAGGRHIAETRDVGGDRPWS